MEKWNMEIKIDQEIEHKKNQLDNKKWRKEKDLKVNPLDFEIVLKKRFKINF